MTRHAYPNILPHGSAKPLILLPACSNELPAGAYQIVGQKYVEAVRLCGALPLVVPFAMADELDQLLAIADGVLLTGSPSNVHPKHYQQQVHDAAEPLDALRDNWTLPLIPKILSLGMPLLAICRGMQEMNVALGGSLHQAVHEQVGNRDHRAPKEVSMLAQYGPAHSVAIAPGGVLDRLLGPFPIEVNSLHGQAVNHLATGLRIEAVASDGVVEAVSCTTATGFNLGVQWHPEWQAASNPTSMQILTAFAQACAAYRQHRHEPET